VPIAMFSTPADFINFVSGKGNEKDLYPLLVALIPGGLENPLLKWTPLVIPPDQLRSIEGAFLVSAAIFSIQSTAHVGRARARTTAVVNFHDRWTPPPPNTGKAPKLGVIHHYRID